MQSLLDPAMAIAKAKAIAAAVAISLTVAAIVVAIWLPRAVLLVARGDVRELRPRASHAPSSRPSLFILAVDGIDRSLLYDMLRGGELPHLERLLGGRDGRDLPHACLDERILTVLPSTTIAAWATVFTGVPPGVHGMTGNEVFARDERAMLAPAPVSIDDISPTLAVYTEASLDRALDVPTIYQQMRARDPGMRIWVAMSQIYGGADRLILAKRSVLSGALAEFLSGSVEDTVARGVYEELDEEVLDALTDELEDAEALPDVLTLYVAGTDLYAHHASAGPDAARRGYLREVLDPRLGRLRARLEESGFLHRAYVVVLSDHGHTSVPRDARHALGTEGPDEPPELLRRAGYRVRPFEWKVDEHADFQAVLAYNGAMASLYLADRSTCQAAGDACDWARPPRFDGDVLPAARAFARANEAGELVPALRGTLDMILVRRDGPDPFLAYTMGGELASIADYLRSHPHPRYVDVERRLRDLGAGPRGHRAGDVLLIANNGNVDAPAERFYFASQYRSWHGSPSRQDGEIPVILAHPGRARAALCAMLDDVFPPEPRLHDVGRLLVRLREP